ncbi:MAG TPA: hypothetical protein VFN74_00545 [Chloroflexota bacterium]|nr:hypothetical protein [Chloroflexota bacterium]
MGEPADRAAAQDVFAGHVLQQALLAEHGERRFTPEITWPKWLGGTRRLTCEGPNGEIYRTFPSGGTFNFFQMIWQNGGEIMNGKRTQSPLDQVPPLEAAQLTIDMRLKHEVSPHPSEFGQLSQGQFMPAGRRAANTTNQSFAVELQRANAYQWDAVTVPRNATAGERATLAEPAALAALAPRTQRVLERLLATARRYAALRLGEHLTDSGRLAVTEDVLFLTREELTGVLRGDAGEHLVERAVARLTRQV